MGLINDTYHINVGTEQLADKMSEVSQRVNETTAAVGIMETAVIAQEKSSAEQVCGKLDVGFFNVVISQIAQRVANENAKTNAVGMELMQQQKSLQNLQNRMTGDYNMISSRYAKLFGSLNQELKNRVTELDKPLMQYCTQHVKQLQNRIYQLVSGVPVLQAENLAATQAIAAARLKHNAQELIEDVAEYVKQEQQQQQVTKRLWYRGGGQGVYYVPVIVAQENTENRKDMLSLKENPTLRKHLGDNIYQQVMQALNTITDKLQWGESDKTSVHVSDYYMQMVDQANLPVRVKELMSKMFFQHFKTL